MKIIDILNAKANGTLKDGFKFRYGNDDYKYKKEIDAIIDSYESDLGCEHIIEQILNDEVEVIEENKEIDTINAYKLIEAPYLADCLKEKKFDEVAELLKQSELKIVERVNDLVYAVRELNKEREEK